MTTPPRVIFIAGMGRSGTTLLGSTLGELDGFCSVGELRALHQADETGDICGCGAAISECPFWAPIRRRVAAQTPFLPPGSVSAVQDNEIRTRPRAMWRVLTRGRDASPESSPQAAYARVVSSTYDAVAAQTGARVIVDTSKMPVIAHVVGRCSEVDLHVLHLVRDPRATAHAWQRGYRFQTDAEARRLRGYKPQAYRRHGVVWSASYWAYFNVLTELLFRRYRGGSRYLRMRYEDFAEHPAEATRRVCDFVGEPHQKIPGLDRGSVTLGVHHTVGGNPIRVRTGETAISLDLEWRDRMSHLRKTTVAALTLPLLLRYGYRT